MSWIETLLEQRLAAAARDGELDGGPLTGRPLPDLDRPRPAGWWAERFVARELSHDRRVLAEAAVACHRRAFWSAPSVDELRIRVATANRAIATANVDLVPADHIAPFDIDDITARWRSIRRH